MRPSSKTEERASSYGPGQWSDAMQAVLLDLAAKSPFPLSGIRSVACAAPRAMKLRFPARRDVVHGLMGPDDLTVPVESHKKRLKRLIDDILGSDR